MIEVIVKTESEKRAYCNPMQNKFKVIGCEYLDCEFGELCRFAKQRLTLNQTYSRLAEQIDKFRRVGAL